MEQKLIEKITEIGEKKGWSVSFSENTPPTNIDVYFQRYSPAGQDFYMAIEIVDNDPEVFLQNLTDYYESFNPDGEALLWCDEDGYGKNGAPHRLKDIIIDFEEIENEIEELAIEFGTRINELKQAATHKIKVQVTEYLQKVVEVDAITTSDACEVVEEMVNSEDIILTADDFTARTIKPYEG